MAAPHEDGASSMKIPEPDHPIAIERNPKRVVVRVNGRVIADSRAALALREADYPVVQYIPRADVDMTQLVPTSHSTTCPFKGDASYFSIAGKDDAENAVWSYETPHDAVAEIREHLAFYPTRVDSIEELDD
jgi:uncharacterized protein (DUF427 family)